MNSDQNREIQPRRPSYKQFGIRTLLVLVMLIACILGWFVHAAHVQHEAIATIKRLGGQYRYDWEAQNRRPTPVAIPAWRKWLIDNLGPDYVGSVTQVHVGLPPSDIKPTLDDLASIGRLGHLEHLTLSGLNSPRQGLAQIRNLSRLKHLDLLDDGSPDGGDLAPLAYFVELEELQLSLFSSGDADLAHLSGLTRLKRLTLANPVSRTPLDNNMITDAGLVALEPLRNLQFLQITGNNKITNAGLAHIGRLTQLKMLTIQGEKLTSVEPLRPLVGLTYLSIGGTGFTNSGIDDAGAASFANFPRLTSVNLMGSRSFSNAGLAHLRDLPNLAVLDLSGTAVDDVGVASLVDFPKLKQITLSFTPMTDVGLAALAKRPGYKTIDVGFTKVTPEGVAAAKAALPGTTIHYQAMPGTGSAGSITVQ